MKRTLATTMLALACLRAGAGAGSPDMPAPLRCHELPWSTDMSSTRAVSRAYAGSPRLFYALRKDDTALLKSELDAGDDPDVCAHDAGILAHAAALGDIDAVEVLLAHGAGVDRVRREDGATPLFDALMMGHFDVATLLLVHGADPLLTTDAGGTVLMNLAKFQLPSAEEAAQLELAAEFVRRGVPVNAQAGAARRTALMSAALDDNRAYVRFLLAHGADPSLQDMRHRTAAHAAAAAHDPDLAALLNAAAQHHDHQDGPAMTTSSLQGRTAVITGAASGFGLETSRLAARQGMNVVMADVLPEPLAAAAGEVEALGVQVLALKCDVRLAAQVEALGAATLERFGAPSLVFNNAGVGAGGLIWEHTAKDWEWVMGVNVMGVAHGVRVFTPMMLAAEKADPGYRGHIVNTASMAGLVNMPNMGVYNVSKHAVVALSETLYQDLALVSERVRAHVLCPYFVPTGISQSSRARPDDARDQAAPATASQRLAQLNVERAVASGRVTAADVAQFVFDAMAGDRFYIYSHPKALAPVMTRAQDILHAGNPSDPYRERPELGEQLKAALNRG